MPIARRQLLRWTGGLVTGRLARRGAAVSLLPAAATATSTTTTYPPVTPGYPMQFPRDHGAHPLFRTEWWYLTAWVDGPHGPSGIQLTFFRSRTRHNMANPSRFAPVQLLFAHAAVASPKNDKLLHAELAQRASPEVFSTADTAITMPSEHGQWQLVRSPDDSYRAVAHGADFSIDCQVQPTGIPVLQGDHGYSRKGLKPAQASYYYSRPQLSVTGTLITRNNPDHKTLRGTGWLDHEWSSELLDDQAVGWDWIGINLDNGDALMAFRIRTATGDTQFSHGRWILNGRPDQATTAQFSVRRQWRSPRTNIAYPVEMDVQVGGRALRLKPLMDDQELDASRSTGTVYWEGAIEAVDTVTGAALGRGYLELTGYAGKVRF